MDADYLRDLADLVLRLLHVVAGIAWIGASFYFIRLDLGLRAAEGAEGGRRRRVLGRPRRRLLPLAEVQGRAADAARAPALVQVGGVHDVALGLRAARRPLLARRRHVAGRPGGRRPRAVAGSRALGRRARARAGSSTTSPAGSSSTTGSSRARSIGARDGLRVRGRRALRRPGRVPPGRRDARHDHGRERLLRDHPGAPGARAREAGGARAGPAAGAARQAAVGAQQLPDAAGRLHDARRALPVRLRQRPRVARAARDLRARRGDPALLQPLAHGQARLVDPRRGRRRPRSRSRSRSRRTTSCSPRRSPTTTAPGDRRRALPACHSGAAAPLGVGGSRRSRRCEQHAAAIAAWSSRRRCRPGTRPG